MNLAFKIMAFTILLNISIGILAVAIRDVHGQPIFTGPETVGGLTERDDMSLEIFIDATNNSITPPGGMEDKGDMVYRVLDLMNLGFIKTILNTIDQYMYGLVNFMETIFGDYMDPDTNEKIFGYAKHLMTFIYIIGAFSLWTGRNFNE